MEQGGPEAVEAVAVTRPDKFRVLAVDDEVEVINSLQRVLRRRGFEVTGFHQPAAALEALEADPFQFDLMILDVNMPGMSGLEVLPRAREISPDLPVIMLTADDSATTAVAALKAGAFNYMVKPLEDPDAVALTLVRAGNYSRLHRRTRALEQKVAASEKFETMVGASTAMRAVFSTIEKLAETDVNVLIHGESGTGKELAARAIHDRSGRARGPFVALNCAALPEALIDSELFGHAKGAFTGAVGARQGVFAEAHEGTLFLDEIGDIPLNVQLRLLRVLQEREVRPVGGSGSRAVDVRVIAATHVELELAVEDKRFRADLYYRLNVVSFTLPALRSRLDDIPLLAAHFLAKHASRLGRPSPQFSIEAMNAMTSYDWPGNVRELENAVQRSLALSTADEIPAEVLPAAVRAGPTRPGAGAPPSEAAAADLAATAALAWSDDMSFNDARRRASHDFERAYMTRLLRRTAGNVSEAARIAGLDRSNFRRVLARLEIDPGEHR